MLKSLPRSEQWEEKKQKKTERLQMRNWMRDGTDLNYSMQIEECSSRYMPSVLDGKQYNSQWYKFSSEVWRAHLCMNWFVWKYANSWKLTLGHRLIFIIVYLTAEGLAMVLITEETSIMLLERIISDKDAINYLKGQAITFVSINRYFN